MRFPLWGINRGNVFLHKPTFIYMFMKHVWETYRCDESYIISQVISLCRLGVMMLKHSPNHLHNKPDKNK